MKNLKIAGGLTLLILAVVSCRPSMEVSRVSVSTEAKGRDGFYYALPRNYIRLEILVDKTEEIRGPYAEFANKYLGLSNVITNNSVSYKISGFTVTTIAEPDPGSFYFVTFSPAGLKKAKAMNLALSEAGLIMNTSGMPDSLGFSPATISADETGNVIPDIFKYYADLNLFEKVDTIIEKVNMDSVTVEKMTFRRSLVEKTPEQKAKNAADFIIKVKENRFNLISGFQEVNYDRETFRYMNEELEKMENEYRKLFTGISFTNQIKYTFTYLPENSVGFDSVALFRFSSLKGVLETDNIYGELVYLKISKAGNTDSLNAFVVRNSNGRKAARGLYYRLPDYARVELYFGKQNILQGRFLLSQFGVTTNLPPMVPELYYYPATGAIRSLSLP